MAKDDKNKYKHIKFLPKYFRTSTNQKLVGSTVDQLFSAGKVKKLSSFVGRISAKANIKNSTYMSEISNERQNYQFEPSVVIKDELDNVLFHKDYIDYIGQLRSFGSNVDNHNHLNSQDMYSWNAHINFDKFTNFREYYWLPNGPQSVPVRGQAQNISSTYTVTIQDQGDNTTYVFSPDGKTNNPTLKLYKGQTYRFEINTPNFPFAIAISREFLPGLTLEDSVTNESTLFTSGITVIDGEEKNGYVENGIIEFTVPENAPDELFYISETDINTSGLINVFQIEENSKIDVEKEILGKKYYTTSGGFDLSNGMKIYFEGNVTPEKYSEGLYYVEGVGTSIVLINENELNIRNILVGNEDVPFDQYGFDRYPFSEAIGYPSTKDYIVSNISSPDKNPWSRYNRWFHIDVINKSAEINNQTIEISADARAKRPIIEFNPGLKMYKNGLVSKQDIDLVDDWTTDVFSIIEGAAGYNIDQVDIIPGMRILFTADQDPLVKNKIFEVDFIQHNNSTQISLKPTDDTDPLENEVVLVSSGVKYQGKQFYYENENWNLAQQKTKLNQHPLFDIFDNNGNSYTNSVYTSSNFTGNKIFSYKEGTGTNDVELGFPLTYKNIDNVGDIVFNFDLLKQKNTYIANNEIQQLDSDKGFVKKINPYTNDITFENAWKKHFRKSIQSIHLEYKGSDRSNNFIVNCVDKSAQVADLKLKVFVNRKLLIEGTDYTLTTSRDNVVVVTNNNIDVNDILLIKCFTKVSKNVNGYYEVPYNLERNPNNDNVLEFTLGEVNDHVQTISQNIPNFSGIIPGSSNLRDLGNTCSYGDRFVQHSGTIPLALFHITSKDYNVIKSIKYALNEYSKFKREFLRIATYENFDGSVVDHVDYILNKFAEDKNQLSPFYSSDTVPFGGKTVLNYTVLDSGNPYYPLSQSFNLNELSNKSVLVYKNNIQLTYEKDYTFTDEGFVFLLNVEADDKIEIHEFETTEGCYVPPTPTKLGLYPLYQPSIITDTTYSTSQKVIQGHDGSKIIAFDDYRDELVLELEKRIFNNVKNRYNVEKFDIYNYLPGRFRENAVTKNDIDNILVTDFINWTNISQVFNFNRNDFLDSNDSFSYNYKNSTDVNDVKLEGFWRAVYKNAFDTDTPNLTPWEMLGFSIQPTWWEEVYGPAPYTLNNLPLWQDLEIGAIKEPGVSIKFDKRFVRPGLTSFIPVDENGNLRSPFQTGFAKGFSFSTQQGLTFEFGDQGPAETAWRRSSEYPFSLLSALIILNPAEIFGYGFDLSRINKNSANNLVYDNYKSLSTDIAVIPSQSTYTAGFVNYITNYIISNNLSVTTYEEDLKSLKFNLSFRLGGFSDKSKINLLLDSKTPNSSSDIFVPAENYSLFLKTSSPYDVVSYSGVVIEKTTNGYKLSGYDRFNPFFNYFKTIESNNDPYETIGGVSESFTTWTENKLYVIGGIVQYNGRYYRVKDTHTSGNIFDDNKFSNLTSLPIVGGKTARFSKRFSKNVSILRYGSILPRYQDVVDFLLGYDAYLKSIGFVFDYNNAEYDIVENFRLSAKEFLFWTTQNWGEKSVITLSPSANRIQFKRDFYIPDSLYDGIFDYEILDQGGRLLSKDFFNLVRDTDNSFTLASNDNRTGIYFLRLFLVQKEHAIIVDNETIFADTLYNKQSGYRQERLKVVGYKTADWSGTLNIPGFVFDEIKITNWNSYTDYTIGDIVKYKDYYYVSNLTHSSDESFDKSNWTQLDNKPENKLLPNFNNKAAQFADFYDLDSDNFDSEQQRLAQHLIGYQKRDYLQNIINDDISQYKFYQGMIQDKGTKNVLTKLFDKLGSADKESIEFFEEWALRVGQYGATDSFEEYEIDLDETQFKLNPQPIELVSSIDKTRADLIYQVPTSQVTVKPANYNNTFFKETQLTEYSKTAGYVDPDTIDYIVKTKNDLLGIDVNVIKEGDYFWVTNEKQSWNVYQLVKESLSVIKVVKTITGFIAEFDKPHNFNVGDIIVLTNMPNDLSGVRQVIYTGFTSVEFYTSNTVESDIDLSDSSLGTVMILQPKRFQTIEAINAQLAKYDLEEQANRVWLDDNGLGQFQVFENNAIFTAADVISNPLDNTKSNFGKSITVTQNNTTVATGDSLDNGAVRIYRRISEADPLTLPLNITAPIDIVNTSSGFGHSIAFSPNGDYLFVGAPDATDLLSRYEGDLTLGVSYVAGDIVNDRGVLYRAKVDVDGTDASTISSTSQDWEAITNLSIDIESAESAIRATSSGVVCVYKKTYEGYELINTILSPAQVSNEKFGQKIECRLSSTGTLLIFVSSLAANGRVYFFEKSATTDEISYSKNPNYKGEFNTLERYEIGDIVYYDGPGAVNGGQNLFVALTSVPRGFAFNNSQWEILDEFIDHKGYIPVQSEILNAESDDIGVGAGTNIAELFDVSLDGDVIILNGTVAFNEKRVSIYRRAANRYAYYESINELVSGEEFATSLAINDAGDTVAIGAIRNDNSGVDHGTVYLFVYNGSEYSLSQTLVAPLLLENELFGTNVSFSNDTLVVKSGAGNRFVNDSYDVTFDNNMTTFGSFFERSGQIYMFQNVNGKWFYGEQSRINIDTKDSQRSIVLAKNNHIYVTYPNLAYNNDFGIFVDLRKPHGETSWKTLSTQLPIADTSKIKKAFIYDKETNDIITFLDVIDPIQGKIAGIAEQELQLKSSYDPAEYTIDVTNKQYNNIWLEEKVGTYWWDLSDTKWYNPYQNSTEYQSSFWNKPLQNATINVYEWVESDYLPDDYDELADTNDGIQENISGQSKYGNLKYSIGRKYNEVTNSFDTKYYFWVKGKKLITSEDHKLSSYDVEQIILDPYSAGISFISPLTIDKFSLNNIQNLVRNKEVVLHVDIYKNEIINDRNIHTEYKLLTEGLEGSIIPNNIVQKWIDSLVGYDINLKPVPDTNLGESKKYGIENRPRQGMFKNKKEALKQVIERINSVFNNYIITDFRNVSPLSTSEQPPKLQEGVYDFIVDTKDDLGFVGTAGIKTAILTPVIENGKITDVEITENGYGYITAPVITITGTGTDAEIETVIDSLGKVINVNIKNQGKNYTSAALTVRPFSVLVNSDSELDGKWSIYEYNSALATYTRVRYQTWNVEEYWKYKDYYATGYSNLTSIDYVIDGSYQLDSLNDRIGQVVKIKDIGDGGWLLLEKIDNQQEVDYTVNYKTVGRQNGTIEILSNIYEKQELGFDKIGYDNLIYDNEPIQELRIILNTIKDYIFIDDLDIEFTNLIFSSIRYALFEQQAVDWVFKTAFLKAKHNLGKLEQKITYKNDSLDSYKDFIAEVKPYSSKIREYVSAYTADENTQSVVTDFDLPPRYSNIEGKIVTENVKFINNAIYGDRTFVDTYPQKHWLENYKFKIKELVIYDQGSGLDNSPIITISGGGGPTLTGKGYRTGDKLTSIDIDTTNAFYTSQPTVTIQGSYQDVYTEPRIIPILGDSPVRSSHIIMKFDRTTGGIFYTDLQKNETFTGTGSRSTFTTKWPLDTRSTRIYVTIDGEEVLKSDYTVSNIVDDSKEFTRKIGQIVFEVSPSLNANIQVQYYIDSSLLNAADRILAYYKPNAGMPGFYIDENGNVDLSQLMDGVSYDGVNVDGVKFESEQGFDVGGFGTVPWDIFSQNEDEIFILVEPVTEFTLSKPLEADAEYNVYLKRAAETESVRIDDPNYDGSSAITNPNALINTIYGDGITDIITVDIFPALDTGDTIVFRKSTSDGSFEPADNILDTAINPNSGFALTGYYNTAGGIESGAITVDGDGFVTETTSKGPEELVPGQIVDTLDIQVTHRPEDGQGIKTSYIYKAQANQLIYNINQLPQSQQALIVNINEETISNENFTVDYENQQVIFNSNYTINEGDDIQIIVIGNNGSDILDIDNFISDGVSLEYITGVRFSEQINSFVTLNGNVLRKGIDYNLFQTDDSYSVVNNIGIRFGSAPAENAVIGYSIYNSSSKTFSEFTIDRSFVGDGVTYVYKFDNNIPFTSKPFTHNMLVKVGNKYLNAGYNIRHVLTDSRVYPIQTWQFEKPTKITSDEVLVFLNDVQLTREDIKWDPVNGRVEFLKSSVGVPGDVLEIYILGNGEYYFIDTVIDLTAFEDSSSNIIDLNYNTGDLIKFTMGDSTDIFATVASTEQIDDGIRIRLDGFIEQLKILATEDPTPLEVSGVKTENQQAVITDVYFVESDNLTFKKPPAEGEQVEVITFSEHDINNFDRISYKVLYSAIVPESSDEFLVKNNLLNGIINLNVQAANAAYVWIIQNNKLLRPYIDYCLINNNNSVQLTEKPADKDTIELLEFTAKVTTEKFGFRIFKDMLNRTHYKRINTENSVILNEPLNYYDQYITVEDASKVPVPNRVTGKPGVIFVDGERIEYYSVEGNLIRQLRRATLGTGAKSVYPAGTRLQLQGPEETIPYADKNISQVFPLTDGSTSTYIFDFNIKTLAEQHQTQTNLTKSLNTIAADLIEVYVGGVLLKKPDTTEGDNNYYEFNKTIDQDSPEADVLIEPEYTIDVDTNTLILRDVPSADQRVAILRKEGKLWTTVNESISSSDSKIARFIRAGTIKLTK